MPRATRALLACLFLAACDAPAPDVPAPAAADTGRLVERSRVTMGSALQLTAWTDDEPRALAAFDAVFAEFERLDGLMSVWREGSDVQRLNAAAGREPVPVSREVREVLDIARQVGDLSDGKFDITFSALADIWKFDHDQDNRIPAAAQIRARLPLVDYRAIRVDDGAGTAYASRPGMRVHLGGIGKGYAVDRGAALLRGRGIVNFLIQSGGDLYAAGMRGDRPWRAGIQDPRGPGGTSFAALDLRDETFSTSGDYERAFVRDGRRYHHLLDPDTGEPAAGARSVTIVTTRAVWADALSTAVFVSGADVGMQLIEKLPEVEGVIVTPQNEVRVSSGLARRLIVLAPPTDGP